jgi:hypothetical protein
MNISGLSRREWLAQTVALCGLGCTAVTALAAAAQSVNGGLVPNQRGGYLFVPGIDAFSFAARAAEGFAVVRTTFRRQRLFPDGLTDVEMHLRAAGRPLHALCGLELRSGQQMTLPEFAAFNGVYNGRMREAGLLVDDRMPLTRTNVVISGTTLSHRLYAFTYTVPVQGSDSSGSPTFMSSGIPEVRNLNLGPNAEVVAAGDTSSNGLRQKAAFVLETIDGLLQTLGVRWNDVTGTQLYTVHDIHPLILSLVLPKIGEAAWRGIQWHHTPLPVVGADIEIDVRSTQTELMI